MECACGEGDQDLVGLGLFCCLRLFKDINFQKTVIIIFLYNIENMTKVWDNICSLINVFVHD